MLRWIYTIRQRATCSQSDRGGNGTEEWKEPCYQAPYLGGPDTPTHSVPPSIATGSMILVASLQHNLIQSSPAAAVGGKAESPWERPRFLGGWGSGAHIRSRRPLA